MADVPIPPGSLGRLRAFQQRVSQEMEAVAAALGIDVGSFDLAEGVIHVPDPEPAEPDAADPG